MERLAFWVRWTWRDLRARWLQVVAIAAIIAIGTGLYSSLTSSTHWRRVSYAESYETLDAHDVVVRLASGTTTSEGRLRALLASLGADAPVAAATERLSMPTQVDATTGTTPLLVAGRIIGVDVSPDGQEVDRVGVLHGRGLNAADDGAPIAVVDVHFAERHHLALPGTARIGAGVAVTYVGAGEAPEQFLSMTDSGTMFAQTSFAVFYTSLRTAQSLTGTDGQVNELAVRFAPGTALPAAIAELRTALDGQPDLAATITTLDEDRVHAYLYRDIDGDQRFFDIFAVLILAGAAFAAFNLTGRMAEAQRREFGVGAAMGADPILLAVRPLLAAAQIIVAGVALGVAVGVGFNALMRRLMAQFLPLPVWDTSFQIGPFARGALLGLAMPLLATLWPIARAASVAPVDALRTGHLASSGGALAPVLRHLRLPGDSLAQMPLRDVVRAPRRTILTALGVASAIATLVGVMGIVDTFFDAVDRGEQELLTGPPSRLTVDLTGFVPIGSAPTMAITSASSVAIAEPALQLGGDLSSATSTTHIEVVLTLLDFDSAVWRPTASEGSLDHAGPGLVLSRKALDDLHVGVGDTVRLQHLRRDGTTSYTIVTTELPVIAVHPDPYRFIAFMDLSHADLMNLTGIVNRYTIVPAEGATAIDVERQLFGTPGIAAVQPVTDVVRSIRDFIGSILDILDVAQGAVMLLAVLIAFNSSTIAADERRRQHATMFAFGVPVSRVLRILFVESLIIGTISTILGIALGGTIVVSITHWLLPTTVPDVGLRTTIAPSTLLTATVLGIAAVAVAPIFTLRRLRRMSVPDMLRIRE